MRQIFQFMSFFAFFFSMILFFISINELSLITLISFFGIVGGILILGKSA